MRKFYLYLLTLAIPLSCSSPQKSFDKGNYEKAYKGALKDIKKGKRSRKDKTLLNKSFGELLKDKSNTAEKYLNSDVIEDWEIAFEEYAELIDLYYDGKVYLDEAYVTRMSEIQESNSKLKDDLAINFYELGEMSMADYDETYNKLDAQTAFRFFEKTQKYDSGFENIDSLLEVSYSKAVIVVLVEADAPFELSYNWEIDQRFSNIENESKDFLVLSYERNLTEVDCVMEIDFASLDIDRRESSNTQTFTDRIEDGYDTVVDTSGSSTRVPRYKTIQGSVTTITENLIYRWRIAVNVQGSRDYCAYNSRYFDAEEVEVNERYELYGDREAIPDSYSQDSNRVNRKEDDVAEELIAELYRQLIRYYFR